MKRTPRVLAAAVAAAALTFTGVHTADAKPAHAGSHAKAQEAKGGKAAKADKLARHVARVQAQLDRTVSEKRLARVDAEDAALVVANVEADKTAVGAALTRAELRSFRVENYRLVVNILRQSVKVGAAAAEAGNAEGTALVESAVAKALAVTATSPKSDVKAARADLSAARDLLEADEVEETEPVEETEETEPTEPVDPVV